MLQAGAEALPGHQEPATPVWMYPSEQMFFNAMKRKGWSPSEQDMQQVVAIHNGVNERAWSEVRHCLSQVLFTHRTDLHVAASYQMSGTAYPQLRITPHWHLICQHLLLCL